MATYPVAVRCERRVRVADRKVIGSKGFGIRQFDFHASVCDWAVMNSRSCSEASLEDSEKCTACDQSSHACHRAGAHSAGAPEHTQNGDEDMGGKDLPQDLCLTRNNQLRLVTSGLEEAEVYPFE